MIKNKTSNTFISEKKTKKAIKKLQEKVYSPKFQLSPSLYQVHPPNDSHLQKK